MSSLSFADAADAIMDVFRVAWEASIYSDYEVRYPNMGGFPSDDSVTPPQSPVPWVSVRIVHGAGYEAISAPPRLYSRRGRFVAHIYIPSGMGLSLGYEAAKIIADAYEGASTPGGVWFRNCQIGELGSDGAYAIVAVTVEFEYTELK